MNFADGSAFKAVFHEPILNSEGHCGAGQLCPCYEGKGLRSYGAEPEIFDVSVDGEERDQIVDRKSER